MLFSKKIKPVFGIIDYKVNNITSVVNSFKHLKLKFKIHIVGDVLNYSSVKNYGFISNKKLQKLLENTKFSFTSNENIYGLFTIECINNNVKLIASYSLKNKINHFKENFIFLDFNNLNSILKLKNY